ncbi:DUF6391 domain-containing protein [Aminivibrio sp.]|uniref:DUF6391 domain-containing protein n=1 Tax=Aminivibrio sp. TaxID=1872489 RepID=UPI001A48F094|nr:DUF6391 domain-containing protein [Aminivibrio sp.]MBL3539678.1 hypothetical protein [Aminivibrio sp.]MDK2958564.1 hypothetical protein [Synergistaceae bacterium]
MPLLVFVLFLFLFPLLVFAVLLLLALLLPIGFTAAYLPGILFSPAKLAGILFSRRVRANHGLAHGTIAVLEERYGPLDIEGLPDEDGFSLRGGLDPEEVLGAARNALLRMQSGEMFPLFRKRCPAASALVFFGVLVCLVPLAVLGGFSAITAAAILMCVLFSARFFSPWIQRLLTVPLQPGDFEIIGAEPRDERRRFLGIEMLVPSAVFIRTRTRGEPLVAEVVS